MTSNQESKALFPEAREGPSSTCEVCGHISHKVVACFDRTFPDKAKVFQFKCTNPKCKGRVPIQNTRAKSGRIWEVEKNLDTLPII